MFGVVGCAAGETPDSGNKDPVSVKGVLAASGVE